MSDNKETQNNRKWILAQLPSPEVIASVGNETNNALPPLVCRLLAQKGFVEKEQIRTYLEPKLDRGHDPFLMKDLDKVVARLIQAKAKGEKLLIHGDYDVDGLSSTTLAVRVLRNLGLRVEAFVPNRAVDGYGVATRALDRAAQDGIKLVLTCDVGTSAVSEIEEAMKKHGMEIYVTDHHHVPEVTPAANAIVNPHQKECSYPFKEICGVGVMYKVLQGLVQRLGSEYRVVEEFRDDRILSREKIEWIDRVKAEMVELKTRLTSKNKADAKEAELRYEELNQSLLARGFTLLNEETVLHPYLDLVALGTVCDVMPLEDENRTWVKHGVKRLRETRIAGLKKLLEVAKVSPEKVDESTCGFKIGPRLNAIGRLDDAGIGLELLLTDNPEVAQDLAGILERANKLRQTMSNEIERNVIEMIESKGGLDDNWGLVMYLDNGHHGVVGIVASRIVEKYSRPTFLLAPDHETGLWKGSGRAPKGENIHLYEALAMCKPYILKFGGHAAAAGLTLNVTDDEGQYAFAKAFNEAARSQMTEEDRIPKVQADMEVTLDELTIDTYRMLKRFAPFGEGNPPIQMIARNVRVLGRPQRIGEDKTHLKLSLEQNGEKFEALMWSRADEYENFFQMTSSFLTDLVFQVEENVWNDKVRLQFILQDIRLAEDIVEDINQLSFSQEILSSSPVKAGVKKRAAALLNGPVKEEDSHVKQLPGKKTTTRGL